MLEPLSGIRILSLEEANALLPQVRSYLQRLRELKTRVVRLQAQVDIEEMTAPPSESLEARVEPLLRELEAEVQHFNSLCEEMQALGCELKDVDQGLVDFYGLRGGEIIYYCWKEGEDRVSHWHALDAGFQGRRIIQD